MKLKNFFFMLLFAFAALSVTAQASGHSQDKATQEVAAEESTYQPRGVGEMLASFYDTTGLKAILEPAEGVKNGQGEEMSLFSQSWGRALMFFIVFLLFYLAIAKGFEPLLLLPIAFGGLLANIPIANMTGDHGMLGIIYNMGIANEFFPLIIFMGVGAMTDFGPLLSRPKTALLGGAAQFGIFGSLVGAAALSQYTDLFDFTLKEASAISIIGGADGPTTIFLAAKLAPQLLGACAVAAYSYMAMVPIIQPPIMKLMTSEQERKIKMKKSRKVSKKEKLFFPIVSTLLIILLVPPAAPLVSMLMLGNLFREAGVVERLKNAAQNELMNIVTIFLGVPVGATMNADLFLQSRVLFIFALGLVAFMLSTVTGILLAKIMNMFSKDKINPLLGAAGVSAVPMAARVVHKVGMDADKKNYLLMYAMGPNVAGVIGTVIAAGIFMTLLGA
jgi:oxaloacetate decarboxylase beta subunit